MITPVVLAALLFWAGVFTVYFTMQGTSPLEYLLGRLEPLPPDLGTWKERGIDEETGWVREERLLLPGGRTTSGRLLHQVRYRNRTTGAVERVEREVWVRRRREKGQKSP